MNSLTLTPAYGSDFKSKKEVLEAWGSGKDFIIADFSNPWNGKPCSIRDTESLKKTYGKIMFRYKKLTLVCFANL